MTPIVSAVKRVALVDECASAAMHCTGRVCAEMIPIVFRDEGLLGSDKSLEHINVIKYVEC